MSKHDETVDTIKTLIKCVPNFPIAGVMFRDIMPMFRSPSVVDRTIDMFVDYIRENCSQVETIVALDARGFLFGPMIAVRLNKPFVPVRKQGKLPGCCIADRTTKEYGKDVLEVQTGALESGSSVIIVDDLLATGGTLSSTCRLVRACGARVCVCLVLIELLYLKGRNNVDAPLHSFINYE